MYCSLTIRTRPFPLCLLSTVETLRDRRHYGAGKDARSTKRTNVRYGDIYPVEGYTLRRPDRRVIYCNGLLYVFPTRRPNIVNFLTNFTFLTATEKVRYRLFVHSAVKPQSINRAPTLGRERHKIDRTGEQRTLRLSTVKHLGPLEATASGG